MVKIHSHYKTTDTRKYNSNLHLEQEARSELRLRLIFRRSPSRGAISLKYSSLKDKKPHRLFCVLSSFQKQNCPTMKHVFVNNHKLQPMKNCQTALAFQN